MMKRVLCGSLVHIEELIVFPSGYLSGKSLNLLYKVSLRSLRPTDDKAQLYLNYTYGDR